MWVGGVVFAVALCVCHRLGWIGGTLRPSPINPFLASVPKLSAHILLMLSQEAWQQILPLFHPLLPGKLRCGDC